MKRFYALAAVIFCTMGMPAYSLSCDTPDILSLAQAALEDDRISIVIGQISSDDWVFRGGVIGADADQPVTFFIPEDSRIAEESAIWGTGPFLLTDRRLIGPVLLYPSAGYRFDLGLCAPNMIYEPTEQLIAQVRLCLSGGQC
ncbi:hypothetical protein [Pseudaestuariivita rosea]|uniref:hypothetical protein n=1 Tax=Pseudaestuariivita rosea TaxID=2763263 RepID=UPI001ABA8107|nr:hypothetical protein [Pseudaestuariivita rosea]